MWRRLNVLIYLNTEWDEAWGGHLELWEAERKTCVKRIAPIFNRAVIFDTYPCPEDQIPHSTVFMHDSPQ